MTMTWSADSSRPRGCGQPNAALTHDWATVTGLARHGWWPWSAAACRPAGSSSTQAGGRVNAALASMPMTAQMPPGPFRAGWLTRSRAVRRERASVTAKVLASSLEMVQAALPRSLRRHSRTTWAGSSRQGRWPASAERCRPSAGALSWQAGGTGTGRSPAGRAAVGGDTGEEEASVLVGAADVAGVGGRAAVLAGAGTEGALLGDASGAAPAAPAAEPDRPVQPVARAATARASSSTP